MLKLWENPMLSIDDRLDAASGEVERLHDQIEMLRQDLETACAANVEYCDKIAALQYAYDLNEALIGKIQEVVHAIASRPVPHNAALTGSDASAACGRSG